MIAGAAPDGGAALAAAARHLDRNEVAEAEAELTAVLTERPENAQALVLLGVVRSIQGRSAEAEAFYRRSLAIDPAQPQAHHNLGLLLNVLGRTDESIAALREAVRLKSNYAEAHLNLALALSLRGDHEAAEKSCRDALRYQPNYLLAKQTLSAELCALGRPKEAEQLLRRTLAAGVQGARQAAALEHNLAMALKQQERFHEALALFDTAQARVPDMPAVDCNRASTLQQLGRIEEAARSYARAAARDPSQVEALAGLALMSALSGGFSTAATSGARAIAQAPDHAIALIALAIVDIEAGDFDAARQKLCRVTGDREFESDKQASFALGFAADALERRGRYAEAFDAYSTSNRTRRALLSQFEDTRARRDVERLLAHFETPAPWSASMTSPAGRYAPAGHVFVLGFMRSGTTLLQTALSTNPMVVSIDEVEFLTEPSREFLLTEEGLERLATVGAAETARWRDAYWKAIHDTGLCVEGRVFIDKMPFNSLRLPLIARLFPDAKVIFAIRDPRDVVLSCFRRRFNPTPFSYEFLDLGDCARFYASTMALTELYREKLPLKIHSHRYEDMIADFDSTIRATCNFAGINWNQSMRDFTDTAKQVDRRSASAAQVRRGLYDDGVGQWRPYREQINAILPVLEPWVTRYGYPPNDN